MIERSYGLWRVTEGNVNVSVIFFYCGQADLVPAAISPQLPAVETEEQEDEDRDEKERRTPPVEEWPSSLSQLISSEEDLKEVFQHISELERENSSLRRQVSGWEQVSTSLGLMMMALMIMMMVVVEMTMIMRMIMKMKRVMMMMMMMMITMIMLMMEAVMMMMMMVVVVVMMMMMMMMMMTTTTTTTT